jgi:hypothetical protein
MSSTVISASAFSPWYDPRICTTAIAAFEVCWRPKPGQGHVFPRCLTCLVAEPLLRRVSPRCNPQTGIGLGSRQTQLHLTVLRLAVPIDFAQDLNFYSPNHVVSSTSFNKLNPLISCKEIIATALRPPRQPASAIHRSHGWAPCSHDVQWRLRSSSNTRLLDSALPMGL